MNSKTQFKKIIGPYNFYKIKRALKYIFKNKDYLEESKLIESRIRLYKTFLKSGDLVFDVGANLGNRVEAFLKMGLKVLAIEPQPDCAKALREKFGKKITVIEKGVASQTGKMKMHLSNVHVLSTFVPDMGKVVDKDRFGNATWNQTIEIDMTTLDELMQQYGIPRFIKIDVEGFEAEVLKGLLKKVVAISFEYMVPEMENNVYECIDLLEKLNNDYKYNYSIGESMEFAHENFMSISKFREGIKEDKFLKSSFGDIYVSSN